MVPSVLPVVAFAFFLFAVGYVSRGFRYWSLEPAKLRDAGRRAFNLFLGLLSYPLVVVSIIILHIVSLLATVVRFTAGRLGGEPVKKIKVRVTFD